MDIRIPEHQLKLREYLHTEKPILSVKVSAQPHPEEPVSLETVTLWLFDGPSIGRLYMGADLRTSSTWRGYGKLSSRYDKKRKVRGVADHIFDAILSSIGISCIKDLGAAVDVIRGKDESKKDRWNLAVYSDADPKLADRVIGICSYHARKFDRPEKPQGVYEFQKTTGIDIMLCADINPLA